MNDVTELFIPIPEAVLEQLDSKTRKKLEDAISNVREQETAYVPGGYGSYVVLQQGFMVPIERENYSIMSNFAKMVYKTKRAEDKAKSLENQSLELANLKESLKNIKKAFK